MATRAEIISSYLAYFGRPADFDGLKFYEAVPFADMISNFSRSPESVSLYGSVFGAAQINAIYQNLFNRDAEPAGLDYWSGRVNSGALSPAAAAYGIMIGAQNADKTSVDNKIAIINLFESKLDTAAEITGYAGAAAAASARAYIKTVDSTAASVTTATAGADAAVAAAVSAGQTSGGLTLTLTTGVDTVAGGAGNDILTADNTGANKQITAADTVNLGDGVDTVRVFMATGDTALSLPTLTGTETLYLNGGALTAFTAPAPTTTLSIDAPVVNTAATYTVNGQAVVLANHTVTANTTTTVTQASTATATSQKITLNTQSRTGANVNTLDVGGTKIVTLNLETTGAASTISLTNTGAAITTLNFSGDKTLTLTENAATALAIATVNASTATGALSLNTSAALVAAGFKFTGGSANDTVTFIDDAFGTITAGTQLDGGAGTGDKIGLFDTAVSAAEAAKINAAVGFEVLGMNAALTLDASTVSNFKQFSLDTNAAQGLTFLATGSKVTVSAAHAANINLSTAVGVSDVGLTIGTATTAGLTVGGNVTIGATTVALVSSGTNAAANVITNLLNADNSTYTITGSNDLTIGTTRATAIGSKYDGSAATGKLNISGNTTAYAAGSSLGDVIIGGTAADTLKSGLNSGSLTGNAGNDTFNVSIAVAGATAANNPNITTVTDLTKGDIIELANKGTEAFTTAKVDVTAAATLAAALDLASTGDGNTNGIIRWFNFGGATYVVEDMTTAATFAATDIAVKLTGTLDLSTSTYVAGTNLLTFA